MLRILNNSRTQYTRVFTNINLTRQFSRNERIIDSIKNNTNYCKLNYTERLLNSIVSTLLLPFGINKVEANHILTYYVFGKYCGYRTEGLVWVPPISDKYLHYCGDRSIEQKEMHITDADSNPIIVNSYIIYHVIDPINCELNLKQKEVLDNWIEKIMKTMISKYTYTQLTSHEYNEKITNDIFNTLTSNDKMQFYGIEITEVGIPTINYSKEIAETMLVKQKAKATIEARKEIVDATVTLIEDVNLKLEGKLTNEDKSKLTTYLTLSMIGSNSPSQVINVN